jgi:hypothetical protein
MSGRAKLNSIDRELVGVLPLRRCHFLIGCGDLSFLGQQAEKSNRHMNLSCSVSIPCDMTASIAFNEIVLSDYSAPH